MLVLSGPHLIGFLRLDFGHLAMPLSAEHRTARTPAILKQRDEIILMSCAAFSDSPARVSREDQ